MPWTRSVALRYTVTYVKNAYLRQVLSHMTPPVWRTVLLGVYLATSSSLVLAGTREPARTSHSHHHGVKHTRSYKNHSTPRRTIKQRGPVASNAGIQQPNSTDMPLAHPRIVDTIESSTDFSGTFNPAAAVSQPTRSIPFAHASLHIRQSLRRDGRAAGIPTTVVHQLIKLFDSEIDFKRDTQRGDWLHVIYTPEAAGHTVMAAEYVHQGHSIKAVRYSDSTGHSAYYTPAGRSLEKTFLPLPVDSGVVSSEYNPARFHPILHRIRAHKGVDFAAPTGTPVHATGDGVVTSRGWQRGYGQVITIEHDNVHTTVYAHLSRFPPNVHPGSQVRQGDVIGYVGATGAATGPHLHYEFHVNGKHCDPLAVKINRRTLIEDQYRADFEQETHSLLTTLDEYKTTFVAQVR